jgi:two-component sensor histidine kinase
MLSNDISSETDRATRSETWLYLEEFTHRAVNDYTAMLAIVRRAAHTVTDDISESALKELANRLQAAAMSLRALRPPADGVLRDLSQELEPLCASLSNSILSPRQIRLTLTSEPVVINAHRCWQLSLIISELVTNAARHAFRSRDHGSINITTVVRGSSIECAVVDNGACGDSFVPGRGTAIVNALVKDLSGAITRNHMITGSVIVFSIPLADAFFIPAKDRRRSHILSRLSSDSDR